MEKLFKLKQNGTNVRTEILAGITTFVTMAYIIFVNPSILGNAIMGPNGESYAASIMLATCIASAIGTLLIGLLANYPFAQAPGMGLNAFFAFTICGVLGYSWQAGLAAVFISGIFFIIITLTGLREAIVKAIPNFLKKAISAGIGLFIAYIGVKNAGLLHFTVEGGHILPGKGFILDGFAAQAPFSPVSKELADSVAAIEASSGVIPAFNFAAPATILAILGLIITSILVVKKVKGSLLIGILATTALGAIAQFGFRIEGIGIHLPEKLEIPSIAPTFGQFIHGFDELLTFNEGLAVGVLSLLTVLISLTLVDMFDTIGTLIGTASKAKLLDEQGNLPRAGRALMADAVATSAGAVLGTSTVTTYIESSAGISEGGRTGLTSVTTAVLFLLAIVFAPVLGVIPAAATAPILIIVGVLMITGVKEIEWDDMEIAIPAFFTMVFMPFSYSIADGIAAGFIFFTLIKIFRGKFKEVHPVMYVLSALFILRFILLMV